MQASRHVKVRSNSARIVNIVWFEALAITAACSLVVHGSCLVSPERLGLQLLVVAGSISRCLHHPNHLCTAFGPFSGTWQGTAPTSRPFRCVMQLTGCMEAACWTAAWERSSQVHTLNLAQFTRTSAAPVALRLPQRSSALSGTSGSPELVSKRPGVQLHLPAHHSRCSFAELSSFREYFLPASYGTFKTPEACLVGSHHGLSTLQNRSSTCICAPCRCSIPGPPDPHQCGADRFSHEPTGR